MEAWQKAATLGPVAAETWNNLGVACVRAGNFEKALEALGEAARLQKNDPEILLNIGLVFHKLGRKPEAHRTLHTLQQLDKEKAAELVLFIATHE